GGGCDGAAATSGTVLLLVPVWALTVTVAVVTSRLAHGTVVHGSSERAPLLFWSWIGWFSSTLAVLCIGLAKFTNATRWSSHDVGPMKCTVSGLAVPALSSTQPGAGCATTATGTSFSCSLSMCTTIGCGF